MPNIWPFRCGKWWNILINHQLLTGWWFGCHFLFSHKNWECHHPNWRPHIFQRGGPTTNQFFFDQQKSAMSGMSGMLPATNVCQRFQRACRVYSFDPKRVYMILAHSNIDVLPTCFTQPHLLFPEYCWHETTNNQVSRRFSSRFRQWLQSYFSISLCPFLPRSIGWSSKFPSCQDRLETIGKDYPARANEVPMMQVSWDLFGAGWIFSANQLD